MSIIKILVRKIVRYWYPFWFWND